MYVNDVSTTLTHHHHINTLRATEIWFPGKLSQKNNNQKSVMGKRSFCNVMKDQQNALRPCPSPAATSHSFHVTQKDKRAFSIKP